MYFKLYMDQLRQWRWTLFAGNHRKVADSGEGYHNETDCLKAVGLVMSTGTGTPVYK